MGNHNKANIIPVTQWRKLKDDTCPGQNQPVERDGRELRSEVCILDKARAHWFENNTMLLDLQQIIMCQIDSAYSICWITRKLRRAVQRGKPWARFWRRGRIRTHHAEAPDLCGPCFFTRRRNSSSKGERAAGEGGGETPGRQLESLVGWSDFRVEVGRLFCRQRGALDGFWAEDCHNQSSILKEDESDHASGLEAEEQSRQYLGSWGTHLQGRWRSESLVKVGLEVGDRGCIKDLDMSWTWGVRKELQLLWGSQPKWPERLCHQTGTRGTYPRCFSEGTIRCPSPALKTRACRREMS